jgi:hypothetical protein
VASIHLPIPYFALLKPVVVDDEGATGGRIAFGGLLTGFGVETKV